VIYLIGSLRSPRIPEVAAQLRAAGYEVFDDWYSPGPQTDDEWQKYERGRGRSYADALSGWHAQNQFQFDRHHLQRASAVVLVLPAGKSAHLELGWSLGSGKPGYILLDGEPERYDIMYNFATAIVSTVDELVEKLK